MRELDRARAGFEELGADPEVAAKALANLEEWLTDERLSAYVPYIQSLVDREAYGLLLDSFWRMIPFGTGGRRGPVGAGPNRINPHTIVLSVQGHCTYLRELLGPGGDPSVVVAYDVREFHDLRGNYPGASGPLDGLTSRDMARAAACCYAANGVTAHVSGPLGDDRDPAEERFISTPELSFLIRELGATGGLNISASHNHPDDNGGKFYNRDGGQEIPPHDEALLTVVQQVTDVRTMPYEEAVAAGTISFIPPEHHEEYLRVNEALVLGPSRSARVAFTPLCGTGTTTVGEALERLGFDLCPVEEQYRPDGSFESVRFRIGNPELPESMDLLEVVAREKSCDIGFSTDPDADRLGMIVPHGDSWRAINGNEIGVLLVETILAQRQRAGTLPKSPIFINTLVTSSLQREIARRYGCQVIGDLMVGFKYMGDVLKHLQVSGSFPPPDGPQDRDRAAGSLDDFVFTCEESHGYLLTPRVRDKDACGAAVHLAWLASELKDRGQSFFSLLRDIFRVYGYHRNQLRSLVMEGIIGLERIGRIQDRLRAQPPSEVAGLKVRRFVDNHVVGGPIKSSTDAASRNVLLFELEDGQRIIRLVVRPSGTEPKTKVYVEVPAESTITGTLADATPADLQRISDADLDGIIAETDARAVEVGNAFINYCLGPEVLGDVYPEVPAESLLVSDLVPVDSKILLCTSILPDLLGYLSNHDGSGSAWLTDRLSIYGEDPMGLVASAATAWIDREAAAEGVDPGVIARARALFR